jgi:hypothetical protein
LATKFPFAGTTIGTIPFFTVSTKTVFTTFFGTGLLFSLELTIKLAAKIEPPIIRTPAKTEIIILRIIAYD